MNRWAPFEWITSIRFLKEGRMQTLFIITGIAIGVAVIVFMSALLTSLQANIVRRVLTSQPHIQIIPPDEVARSLRGNEPGTTLAATIQRPTQRLRSIDQWQTITAQLVQHPDITYVSPNLSASALAVRGDASRSITMTGIDPLVYFKIVKLPDFIVLGTLINGMPQLTSEDIIIGTELAKDLGVTVGDKLNVTAASGNARLLTVSAIFDLGNKGANSHNAFVALRTAQVLANLVGGVLAIDITVVDPYQAEVIAQEISVGTGRTADSWIKTNAQFFTAINAQKLSFGVIRLFVGLSVAFGIASVLVVSVIQRSKDIGILRAMGTSQRQILRVFLLQGALLGFLGSIVGSALGGLSFLFFHSVVRQSDGTEIFPFSIEPSLFVSALVLAVITGVAAAAVPALRAARLDPVVAMRG
ncbi:MAG: FtsX-like permease family protein [Alphaproteobacteria bacterium]